MPDMKRIKLSCAVLFILAIGGSFFLNRRALAFAEGPVPGHTGAPGELTCATSGCHDTAPPNTGPGHFTINGPSSYQPGQTYQITVQHVTSDMTRMRWGFQLTALTGGGTQAGNIQSTSSVTQDLTDDGVGTTRQYIEHTLQGTFAGTVGGASWTFNWTAPASDVGTVTFYAAGNQANNDGLNTGDQIYTATKTSIAASQSTGPPVVTSADVQGKRLLVTGRNFQDGAVVLLNGDKQKTRNDDQNPSTLLICKKAGRLIDVGSMVTLEVDNPDGTKSNAFPFIRQN